MLLGHDPIAWISAPFGFQHVAKMERPTANRNSQDDPNPQELINAPPRDLQSSLARRDRPQKRPPPLRPKRPDETLPPELLSPAQLTYPPLRHIRSAETIAQVASVPPLPNSPLRTAPLPPRRSSSRRPMGIVAADLDAIQQFQNNSRPNELTLSGEWDRLLPLYESSSGQPGYEQLMVPTAHPEHRRTSLASPHFVNPPLELVPEEPEGAVSPMESTRFSRQSSLRHARSSPNIKRSGSGSKSKLREPVPPLPPKIKVERPSSQGSDTLGDMSRRSFIVKEQESKGRTPARDTGGSWEDDVDYCYKHAAEADCDFDWSNTSRFEDANSSDDDYDDQPLGSPKNRRHYQSLSTDSTSSGVQEIHNKSFFHQSTYVPSRDSIPDLDYRSAHTASSNSLAVGTPHEKVRFPSIDGLRRSGGLDSVRQSPELSGTNLPQLPPLELKSDLTSEHLYDDLLSGPKFSENSQVQTLEPKTFTCRSPTISQLRIQSGNSDSSHRIPPAPTSAPIMKTKPFSLIIDKELPLPPLPPKELPPTPPSAELFQPSNGDLSVDSIVAQLRTNESPIDSAAPPFPFSMTFVPMNFRTPIPRKPTPRKLPSSGTEAPVIRTQELNLASLSRNASNETVIHAAPPSPPESPKQDGKLLTVTSRALPPRSASFNGRSPLALPILASKAKTTRAPSLPVLPFQAIHRSTTSDGIADGSPPLSPKLPRSNSTATTSTTTSARASRQSYTLFPPPAKPPKQRRVISS
jgi:hypothetical protein